jgi:hypothetical protein
MADGIPSTEQELLEEAKGFSAGQLAHLRQRALNQVYFMARGVLGHRDVNLSTHGEFCRMLDIRDPEHPLYRDRRMYLMPRRTLKSTIATEADSLRIGLRDPDNERILIANEVVSNAIGFVTAIMGYCEKNDLLRLLFADRIPSRFTGPGVKWSATDGASLVRKTSWKEPTWFPIGVGGAAVSKHFSRIKCDDLIGEKAYYSDTELKSAIGWVDLIEGLVISEHETIIDFIGTRWRRRDLYQRVMKNYGEDMLVFRRKLFEEMVDGTKQIIFPGKFSWKWIEREMRQKPAIFFAQYMNDPISEELTDFGEESLRYYRVADDGSFLVEGQRWTREVLDVVMTCDPNSGSKTAPDEAAICVSAMTPKDQILVLHSWGGRPDPDEYVDEIFKAAMQWRPRVIGIEKAGQQNTIHYLKKKMREERVYFNVQEVHHKNQEKTARIRQALSTPTSEHKLFLRRSQSELRQQILDFPDVENDDRIDSLAYGAQLWRRPYGEEQLKENDEAVAKISRARNKRTGY